MYFAQPIRAIDLLATIIDDGHGLRQEPFDGGREPLEALFASLTAPDLPFRGYLPQISAVSRSLTVETVTNGTLRQIGFSRGHVVNPITSSPAADRSPGTTIHFTPDWDWLGETDWPDAVDDLIELSVDQAKQLGWWKNDMVDRISISDLRH